MFLKRLLGFTKGDQKIGQVRRWGVVFALKGFHDITNPSETAQFLHHNLRTKRNSKDTVLWLGKGLLFLRHLVI